MTDYFMPFFRKNNLNLFLFFSLITYLSLTFANIENIIEIKQIKLEKDKDKIIITNYHREEVVNIRNYNYDDNWNWWSSKT